MPFFRQFPKTSYDFVGQGVNTQIIDIFRFIKIDDAFVDDTSIYTYYEVSNGDRPDIVSNKLYKTPDYYWTFFILNEHLKSGLAGWPMNSVELDAFIEQEYAGVAIQAHPQVEYTYDSPGVPGEIKEYINTIAGKFHIGEVLLGKTSGATGTIIDIINPLNQLVVKMISGSYLANEALEGQTGFNHIGDIPLYQQITSGAPPLESWQTKAYTIYDYRNAPHHFEDQDGRIVYPSSTIDETKILIDGVLYDNTVSNSDTILTPVTNYEYEVALNDERGKIRVVRADAIYDFASKFKELINA